MSYVSFFVPLLCLLIISCGTPATTTPPAECDDEMVLVSVMADEHYAGQLPGVDTIMTNYLRDNPTIPGCMLGIVRDNEIQYLSGYGYQDATRNPTKRLFYGTMHPIGSISKTITALSILKLEQMGMLGELGIDEDASDFLPEAYNDFVEGVAIRDLLTHGSRLPLWPNWLQNWDTEYEFQRNLGHIGPGDPALPGVHPAMQPSVALIGYATNTTRAIDADNDFYSNTGYSVLGAIVDHVISRAENSYLFVRDFERFTKLYVGIAPLESVTEPGASSMLSMCLYTPWRLNANDIVNLPPGHDKTGGIFTPRYDPLCGPSGWRGPSGGWAMTIGDLCRMMIGIEGRLKVTPDQYIDMTNTRNYIFLPGGSDVFYGLGIIHENVNGLYTYKHSGGVDGYSARFQLWATEEVGVACMCNRNDVGMGDVVTRVAELYINDLVGDPLPPEWTEISFPDSSGSITPDDLAQLETMVQSQDLTNPGNALKKWLARLRSSKKGQALIEAYRQGDAGRFSKLAHEYLAFERSAIIGTGAGVQNCGDGPGTMGH